MANYDVDIEIALRGADKLKNLQADLRSVTKEVGKVNAATIKLNRALGENFSRRNIANVNNYSNAVKRAERALRNAAAGTDAEKRAVSALVTAQKEYNAQIDRQNKLLEEERRIQGVPTTRKQRPTTPALTGSDRVSIRSSLASPVFGARNIAGSPMAKAFGFQEGGGTKAKGVTRKDRIEAAVSAGAFPLLFGGGAGMAAGGAIGGFAAGQTFGPAAIALQVLGGAIDDAAEKQKQLGLALKEGKGVVTAYEAAVTRLSSAKREYLNNLEQSGQKQKLFEETVKQAEEDLGFFGKILIANAQNAGKFDRGVQKLTNSLKALAVAAATPAFLQSTPEKPQDNLQNALTQAAKDRVNAVVEEAETATLTLQTKQKQFNLERKLNEATIENVAAAQTAEIIEERRVVIAQAMSDEKKGLITESEKEEKITIATKEAEIKLLDVEKQRTTNAERLRQKKEQIARESVRAAAENARFDAEQNRKELDAFKLQEQLRGQINLQIVDEAVKRLALIRGEEAGLRQALDMSNQRLGAEQQLLALENASLTVKLAGYASEEDINEIMNARTELLTRNSQIRNAELQNALNQLQIEKDLNALRATQETKGVSTTLSRSLEDAQFRLADPFGTDENEMLELRIKQVRRLEDARTSLNNQIAEQTVLLKKGTPDQQKAANTEIKNLKERMAMYNELLPQLDAVEQAQLRQKQIMEQIQPVADVVAQGIVNVFRAVVDGSMSAKEAFADMLNAVADVLFKESARIIATYIAIGVARAFAGLGGGESATLQTGPGQGLTSSFTDVNPGVLGSLGYAEGGYVSGPTRALVGEGGEPEYIIPQSKMRESMARYSRGARGSAVIPESGESGTSGEGGGTAVAAPIDVRFNVERINNVDYVTAEEFQVGMQRAAAQGAQRGQQLALTRLQQSPNTRRRLGL